MTNGIHRIERDVRISERRQLVGQSAKAAILSGVLLSKVVLKHAKHSANLLDVLARFILTSASLDCGISQFLQRLFELPGDDREMSLGRRFPLFQPIGHKPAPPERAAARLRDVIKLRAGKMCADLKQALFGFCRIVPRPSRASG